MPRCSRRYGDVVRLRFPGPLVYLPGHPNRIEYVLVKESMRPCSPARGIGRESVCECELGGYRVPATPRPFVGQRVCAGSPPL